MMNPRVIAGVMARALAIVFQFLIVHWYAKSLPPIELGTFYFLSTISYVINAVILVPIDLAQQPKALDLWLKDGTAFPSLILQLKLFMTGVGVAMIGESFLWILSPRSSGLPLLLMFMALTSYALGSWRTFFNNIRWNEMVIANYILEPAFRYLSLLVLLKIHWVSPKSVILGASISYFSVILLFIAILSIKGGLTLSPHVGFHVKNLMRQAFALSSGVIANLVQMQGYRLILVPLGFASDVGRFGLVSQLGITATGSAGAIYGLIKHPEVYRDPVTRTRPFVQWALLLILALSVGAITVGPYLLNLVTSGKYTSLFPLLVIGVLLEGGNLIGGALSIGPTKRGAIREIITASITGLLAFFSILVVLLAAHWITVWTIGIPLFFGQFAGCVILYLLEKRTWEIK